MPHCAPALLLLACALATPGCLDSRAPGEVAVVSETDPVAGSPEAIDGALICNEECKAPTADPFPNACPASEMKGYCMDYCVPALDGITDETCARCIAQVGNMGWGGCNDWECICYTEFSNPMRFCEQECATAE